MFRGKIPILRSLYLTGHVSGKKSHSQVLIFNRTCFGKKCPSSGPYLIVPEDRNFFPKHVALLNIVTYTKVALDCF
jgi:hypothetical protein